MKIKNNIVIIGAGESGTGAALLAQAKGYTVFASDTGVIAPAYKTMLTDAGIAYEEGQHTENMVMAADLVIKSPGVSDKAPIIQKLRTKGIEIIDELEFAFRHTRAKIIAITGTNGKTTTTLLTYHILKTAGFDVGLAGNVGKSMALQVMEGDHDYYVTEVSSFQLDGMTTFQPHVGILLNITPDHLDRYEYKMENYINSKFSIVQAMAATDHFIYYANDPLIEKELAMRAIVPQGYPVAGLDALGIDQEATALRGAHNAINMAAAVTAAELLGVDRRTIIEALKSFKNAPHRMEYVATINEVDFVNDSKATNVDAVKYALESFSNPLVWIAGGVDKGNNYDLIMDAVNTKVKALVCMGKDNSRLRDIFHEEIVNMLETDNMKDAVRGAMQYAAAHDTVLLSPACASFELFNNYEDRGDQFREAVLELKKEFENKALGQ